MGGRGKGERVEEPLTLDTLISIRTTTERAEGAKDEKEDCPSVILVTLENQAWQLLSLLIIIHPQIPSVES